MLIFASVVHVLLCVFMIFVILLQPGKDAGMGAALGGGAATTAFGGRGAVTFLGKVTAVCAIAFFVTSLGLSFVGLRSSVAGHSGSVTDTVKDQPKPTDTAKPVETGNAAPNNEMQNPTTAPTTPIDVAPKAVDGTEAVPAEKNPKAPSAP